MEEVKTVTWTAVPVSVLKSCTIVCNVHNIAMSDWLIVLSPRLLIQMGAEQLLEIFKVEIGYVTASTDGLTPSHMWWKAGHTAWEGANFDLSILCRMDVLGELLVTLNQCWREDDANRIHGILSCLPKTSRFNLAVEFLTRTEKKGVGPSWCLHNFLSLRISWQHTL